MYLILFIDDLIHITCVYLMRQTYEVFMIFKKFKDFLEKQTHKFFEN